jgi:PAS domain S-box-containing protein
MRGSTKGIHHLFRIAWQVAQRAPGARCRKALVSDLRGPPGVASGDATVADLRALQQALAAAERRIQDLEGQLAARAAAHAALDERAWQDRFALQAILESMSEGVYTTDLDRRIQYFNPAAERITGYQAADVVGRPYVEALGVTDATGRSLHETGCPLQQCIATKRPAYLPHVFLTTAAGERLPVALSTAPILNPRGGPAWCVAVIRDTRREREVEELKSQLIAHVSHELRTPLTHIKGYASSLLQTDVQWDTATQREFLEAIEQEADRLAKLIADLLDMSRIEAGALERLERAPVAPAILVTSALRRLGRATASHPVHLDVPDNLPLVLVDPPQIERVLVNLIENAAKYSPPDAGILIQARVEPGSGRGSSVVVRVRDRGIGIAAEHLERIFERFYRVPGVAGRWAGGTGLGLAICKGIVEAHGGRIWAESTPGQGSTFTFTLPVAEPDPPDRLDTTDPVIPVTVTRM